MGRERERDRDRVCVREKRNDKNETRISSILRLKQLESLVYHHHVGYATVINAFSEN
jgi:hypothetical protein